MTKKTTIFLAQNRLRFNLNILYFQFKKKTWNSSEEDKIFFFEFFFEIR